MKFILLSELLIYYKLDCEFRDEIPTLTGWIRYWRKTVLETDIGIINSDGKVFRKK